VIDMVKESLEELQYPEYWDNRYVAELKKNTSIENATLESFEWFRDFEKLRPFLAKHLPAPAAECHILHLGCGNSVRLAISSARSYEPPLLFLYSPMLIMVLSIRA
jgi:hypothetical protein